ncbi:DUF72 domain-containing protein [candidate division CSSED10-310 bacterium]|uniref:DUF72 domain-containing protein n=1 Tax=candidate division CSSED10-310 bacterium TaxID=2855610 RepID=A0ABV6YVW4_UNCC1
MDFSIPSVYEPYLKVGTCSWKYDSWQGLIYPDQGISTADDYLPFYARHFTTVEVDQWFWSLFPAGVKLPDPGTVKMYEAQVGENFEFTIKVPNALTLTHFYKRQSKRYSSFAGKPNESFLNVDLCQRFLDIISPLGNKIGPLMFQFEYLNKSKMPSLKAFLDKLHEFFTALPTTYRYAIETRNPNYLKASFFDFLREHNLGFVFLEGYYMPPLSKVFAAYDTETADFSVIRLHGPDRQKIEEKTDKIWNNIVQPQDHRIQAAVEIVQNNFQEKRKTYVNVNNHFEGSAPLTIKRFLDVLVSPDPFSHGIVDE